MTEHRIRTFIGILYLIAAIYALYKFLDELNRPGFPYFPWLLFTGQVPLVRDLLALIGLG